MCRFRVCQVWQALLGFFVFVLVVLSGVLWFPPLMHANEPWPPFPVFRPPGLDAPPVLGSARSPSQTTKQTKKHVSPSKARRDFSRAAARERFLAKLCKEESHKADCCEDLSPVPLEQVLRAVLEKSDNAFSVFFRSWQERKPPDRPAGRQRDIFPISPVEQWDFSGQVFSESAGLLFLNACVAALNFLAGDLKFGQARADRNHRHTAAQRSVLKHLADRVARFLGEVVSHCSGDRVLVDNAFGDI